MASLRSGKVFRTVSRRVSDGRGMRKARPAYPRQRGRFMDRTGGLPSVMTLFPAADAQGIRGVRSRDCLKMPFHAPLRAGGDHAGR